MKKSESPSRVIATLAIMAAVIIVANLLDKAYSFGLVALGGQALAVCALISVVTFSLAHNKFYYAIAAGVMFGIVSFILAFIFPSPLFQNPLASIVPRMFVGMIGYGMYKLAQLAGKGILFIVKKFRLGLTLPVLMLTSDVSGMICFLVMGNAGSLFFLYLVLFVLGALLSIGLLLAVETAKAEDSTRKLEHFSLCVGSLFTVVSNTALVLPMLTLVSYISDTYKSLSAFYATLTVVNFLPELLITVVVAPMVIFGVRRGLHLDVSGASKKTTRKVVQSDGEI